MALERRVGAFHDAISFAPNGLIIVVLASHSPPTVIVLRVRGEYPRLSKKPRAASLASTVNSLAPRAAGEFFQRVAEHGARPLPGRGRMHVEHVDARIIGKRREADCRAAEGRDQRQLTGKFCAEFFLVVGRRRPRLLLRLAVVLDRQFLDGGAENLREQRHIRRQHRPQRELRQRAGGHDATFALTSAPLRRDARA